MPTTPNFAIPYPPGGAAPNVPADMRAMALFIDNLLKGLVPISASIGFGGDNDPAGGFWLLEDGRALNAVTDASLAPLYAAIGNKYGGTDNTNFRLPDSRGRSDVAPSNMGATHGGNQTGATRVQAVLGDVLGEALHTLSGSESGVNSNGRTANGGRHNHDMFAEALGGGPPAGVTLSTGRQGILGAAGAGATPALGYSGAGGFWFGIGTVDAADHLHGLTARSADTAHNTVHPVICKNKIMRVR